MELQEILRLMAEKYPSHGRSFFTKLLLWDDESGLIYRNMSGDYGYMHQDSIIFFEFNTIDELIQHLQEK